MMNIGSLHLDNNVFLAPMAGITNLPYRRVMKRCGAGLVFTEMVSANGLIREGRRTRELLYSSPEERPLAVQLFGDDPAVLAEAARRVAGDGELVDLNMGCPVNKVIRSGAGSALLRDPQRVEAIVSAVRGAVDLPLTVKIRSGWDADSINYLEIGRIAEACGADGVTLHPRTRSQGFGGRADWDHIGRLKETLSIPVIGSGDIFTADDALEMLRTTGCDGVMIGRGGYGNPWLIRDILARQAGTATALPTKRDRLQMARLHLQLFVSACGPRKALLEMRKHLCWYSRGLPGATSFRTAVNQSESIDGLQRIMDEFFIGAPAGESAP